MRLQVEKLRKEEAVLHVEEDAGNFPALAELEKREECRFLEPVSGQLRAIWANGFVEVKGLLRTRVKLNCSRCLTKIDIPLEVPVSLTFAHDIMTDRDGEEGEEIELSAEDVGLIPFEGDEIDLREFVAEQIVLAFPFRPLCDEDCKGLCPHCGVDRNVATCQCSPPVMNNKFAALKDFKAEK